MHYAFVYIMASKPRGVLYTGVTSDLPKRAFEHRTSASPSFTGKYNVRNLVWFEAHDDIQTAIRREKSIKRWRRDWKIALVEQQNPDWLDLALGL